MCMSEAQVSHHDGPLPSAPPFTLPVLIFPLSPADVPRHPVQWATLAAVTASLDLLFDAVHAYSFHSPLSLPFHHIQCGYTTRKEQNFSLNQPLLYTGDSSGTDILSLIVLFHKKTTLPPINLSCESTGSSVCQKSNYWLFPVSSLCCCSWKCVSISNQS